MIFNSGGDNCSILASTNYLMAGNIVTIVVSDIKRLTPCVARVWGAQGRFGFITGGLNPAAHKIILDSPSPSCNNAIMMIL